MSIGGKVKEVQEGYVKRVGLTEVKVITINPNREEFKEILGRELDEESKADNYIGESKDGNPTVRIDVWVEDIKTKNRDKITFFLEQRQRTNKEATKKQYINNIGSCSWASDPNDLPNWFAERDYRVAYSGEEELYNFLRTWLGKLDYRDADSTLMMDWKNVIKGNLKDIKAQINGEYATTFVVLLGVKTTVKESEEGDKIVQYQSVYNKAFLPTYALKQFRVVDYDKESVQQHLKTKASKDLKPHERFVLNVIGEYGFKDSTVLKDAKEYVAEDFLVSSNQAISSDGTDY